MRTAPHLPALGSGSAAQQPQPNTAASPTRPSVFIAMPPDDTPAATRPARPARHSWLGFQAPKGFGDIGDALQ